MNVIPFPDPGRVFSRADRDSICRFAEQFPNCDLEFGKQMVMTWPCCVLIIWNYVSYVKKRRL
jgi:hypothetical protein